MLLARLGTPAPIRYVQDAILNLRHPYIGVATATPDMCLVRTHGSGHKRACFIQNKVQPLHNAIFGALHLDKCACVVYECRTVYIGMMSF